MPMAVWIGKVLSTRALIYREKQFLYCPGRFFPVFGNVLEEVSDVTLSEKSWIISVTVIQKQATSATQWKLIVFRP